MTLAEFIKQFVCPNTMIRLWVEAVGGHRLLTDGDSEINMEWEILNDSDWGSAFKDWFVIGVTDILCDSYKEAVNIVITKEKKNG